MFWRYKRLIARIRMNANRKKKDVLQEEILVISEEPDMPLSFGYKCCWLAIKEKDPEVIIQKLGCRSVVVSNWESADKCMREIGKVFVTPCLDEYTLVINVEELTEYEDVLEKIAAEFEEVQYFASHRVVDLYSWARYRNGKIDRKYCYIAGMGEAPWNEGALTREEITLGLTKLPSGDCEKWEEDCTAPDEEIVIQIARGWGIDPYLTKYQDSRSTGYLCELDWSRT